MQFYKHMGKWLNLQQIKKVREKEARDREIFCYWCISKATRHTKDCPTRNEGFNPETVPKLTEEQRMELLNKK